MNDILREAEELLVSAHRVLTEEYGLPSAFVGEDEEEFPEGEMPQEENLAMEDDRISQIRDIALQGVQEYANDVDTEQYQFYKKIWLMCDKAVSEKDSVGGEGNS